MNKYAIKLLNSYLDKFELMCPLDNKNKKVFRFKGGRIVRNFNSVSPKSTQGSFDNIFTRLIRKKILN